MARPRKDGLEYFAHDTNAANDKKIEALRMLYGNDGYAFYFIMLELIYQEPTFELDISDAETIQILSKKVGINTELFEQILQTALKRDCFDRETYNERRVLTSNGIKKRASVVVEKREKMRKYYEQKVSAAETGEETPQSKVKVKESINKRLYGETVYLTDDQYQKLISDFGKEDTEYWISKLDEWQIDNPKKKKTDHNRTIRNWIKSDERRNPHRKRINKTIAPLPTVTTTKEVDERLESVYKQRGII